MIRPLEIKQPLTKNLIGKASEHMVCLDLLSKGIHASICPDGYSPYDVIFEHPMSLKPIRVQVKAVITTTKSCQTSRGKKYISSRFMFHTNNVEKYKNRVDLFAFVVLSEGLIRYYKPEEILNSGSRKAFNANNFRLNNNSFEVAINDSI